MANLAYSFFGSWTTLKTCHLLFLLYVDDSNISSKQTDSQEYVIFSTHNLASHAILVPFSRDDTCNCMYMQAIRTQKARRFRYKNLKKLWYIGCRFRAYGNAYLTIYIIPFLG